MSSLRSQALPPGRPQSHWIRTSRRLLPFFVEQCQLVWRRWNVPVLRLIVQYNHTLGKPIPEQCPAAAACIVAEQLWRLTFRRLAAASSLVRLRVHGAQRRSRLIDLGVKPTTVPLAASPPAQRHLRPQADLPVPSRPEQPHQDRPTDQRQDGPCAKQRLLRLQGTVQDARRGLVRGQ